MTLSNRQGTTVLPLRDYPYFIASVEQSTTFWIFDFGFWIGGLRIADWRL